MSADAVKLGDTVSIEQLISDLHAAGIHSGDNLIVHSSLKSIGRVEDGADGVIRALVDALGETGNLMVPTFTFSLPMWNGQPFDINASRSRVGALTDAVRKWPGAKRSFHPTHSVAVIGPDAVEITANHMHATAIGKDSPFARMHARAGKILMLGTFQDTNSSLHYCEVVGGLPYINVPFSNNQDFEVAWFFNEAGQVEYTQLTEMPGCSRGFRAVEPLLRERGILTDIRIGGAESQLLDLKPLVSAMTEILRDNSTLLLCNTPGCIICPKRRAAMKQRTN